jgi:hypothetical protein
MRRFELHRDVDESGVSGTGKVAEGVEFGRGLAVLHWLTATWSAAFYPSMENVEKIHGHDGKTRVVWIDE